MGRIWASGIVLAIFGVIMLTMYVLPKHDDTKRLVANYVYSSAESVSTSGEVSGVLFDMLSSDLRGTGGDYLITFKLQKLVSSGVYDTYIETSDDYTNNTIRKGSVIGRPLNAGDRVVILAVNKVPSLVTRMLDLPVLRGSILPEDDFISATSTAVITMDAANVVFGYDVIADLNTNDHSVDKTIRVVTKLASADYKSGDSYKIKDASDSNYIFPSGKFVRNIDVDDDGKRVINYVQRY